MTAAHEASCVLQGNTEELANPEQVKQVRHLHTLWQDHQAKGTAALQGKLPFKGDSSRCRSTKAGQASYTNQHTLCCAQMCIVVRMCDLWQVPAHIMAHTCMHHGTHAGTQACANTKCTLWAGKVSTAHTASCSSQSNKRRRNNGRSRAGQASHSIQAPGQVSQAKDCSSQPPLAHRCTCTHHGAELPQSVLFCCFQTIKTKLSS